MSMNQGAAGQKQCLMHPLQTFKSGGTENKSTYKNKEEMIYGATKVAYTNVLQLKMV